MSIWDRAGAIIDATFKEEAEIIYTGAGLVGTPITAIRSDVPAPEFPGAGRTLRKITYEVRQSDLPEDASGEDTFTHRGVRWSVQDVTRRDDIGKWELVVVDEGPAT